METAKHLMKLKGGGAIRGFRNKRVCPYILAQSHFPFSLFQLFNSSLFPLFTFSTFPLNSNKSIAPFSS